MLNDSDTSKFLQVFFGTEEPKDIFFVNLKPSRHRRSPEKINHDIDCYLTPGRFAPSAKTNTGEAVLEVAALVLDDVGTAGIDIFTGKLISKVTPEQARRLGAESAIIRTSEDNHHYWFKLSRPVKFAEWFKFRSVVDGIIGTTPDSIAASALFRAPFGRNVKRGNAVELIKLVDGDVLDVDALLAGYTGSDAAKSSGFSRGGVIPLKNLEKFVMLVPNDATVDRHAWGDAMGHRIWALAEGSEEGFEIFDAWSKPHESYDAQATRAYWDSIREVSTSGRELLVAARRVDPDAYDRLMNTEAGVVFDDNPELPSSPPPKLKSNITATPYQWVDPDKIPPRDWLYGRILIRQFISMTVAPGGVGKSSLIAAETLAQVSGRDLLGEPPSGRLRVWLWNLEDPHRETQRKLQAAATHYGIDEKAIGDRLFVDSGRDQRLVVAEMDRNGPMIVRPVIGALVEQIKLRKIDVVVIDPFVSCHGVPENDNMAQDMVVKEWGRVADQGNCAVHLIDHTRKAPAGTEVNTESSRGAKAKTDAARVVRVVNRMTDKQSTPWGVVNPWRYFNTFNDKANMAPPVDRRDWFYLESVPLGNNRSAAEAFSVGARAVEGDDVGVVRRWVPPSAQDLVTGDNFKAMVNAMGVDEWRKDPRSGKKWIGNAAAKVLELNLKNAQDRETIKDVLAQWFKAGLFKEVTQHDKHRKPRTFIKITGGF